MRIFRQKIWASKLIGGGGLARSGKLQKKQVFFTPPLTERVTNDDNDDYYGNDENLPKTYQYYAFGVQIYD